MILLFILQLILFFNLSFYGMELKENSTSFSIDAFHKNLNSLKVQKGSNLYLNLVAGSVNQLACLRELTQMTFDINKWLIKMRPLRQYFLTPQKDIVIAIRSGSVNILKENFVPGSKCFIKTKNPKRVYSQYDKNMAFDESLFLFLTDPEAIGFTLSQSDQEDSKNIVINSDDSEQLRQTKGIILFDYYLSCLNSTSSVVPFYHFISKSRETETFFSSIYNNVDPYKRKIPNRKDFTEKEANFLNNFLKTIPFHEEIEKRARALHVLVDKNIIGKKWNDEDIKKEIAENNILLEQLKSKKIILVYQNMYNSLYEILQKSKNVEFRKKDPRIFGTHKHLDLIMLPKTIFDYFNSPIHESIAPKHLDKNKSLSKQYQNKKAIKNKKNNSQQVNNFQDSISQEITIHAQNDLSNQDELTNPINPSEIIIVQKPTLMYHAPPTFALV
jgi:hypothetical protein